ncbi:MAG: A/G-specific adenine glycosylase [Myxococcota bacterium]|jgi:A/G-specific adenine glycosylase|nr:A/G-specific adenine glycosylase [Myxococcota bacterium]
MDLMPHSDDPWVKLGHWFRDTHSAWPWRTRRTPYGSWVAEVMSQQTGLGVVAPRWQELMDELPDVASLAACHDEVLRRLWAGLGYYARARNLRRGAQHIALDRHGAFPTTYAQWLEVPGCGPYTAAILASLHGQQRVPCIDGNVVRVVSRLLDLREGTHSPSGRASTLGLLEAEIERAQEPGTFNEAMMELGQRICRKTKPLCQACPLGQLCLARSRDAVEMSPPPRPRRAKVSTPLTLLVLRRSSGEVALLRRTSGLLRDTFGLPILSRDMADTALQYLEAKGARPVAVATDLAHSITHHVITATVWTLSLRSVRALQFASDVLQIDSIEWCPFDEAPACVASSLDRKALLAASGLP